MSILNDCIAAIANKENKDVEDIRKWSLEIIMTLEIKQEWNETSKFYRGYIDPPLSLNTLDEIDRYISQPVLDYDNLQIRFDEAERECKKYVEYIHDIQKILAKYKSLG